MMTDDVLSRLLQDRKTTIPSCLLLALFGPDRPGWRRLFLRVKRTAQLRARTSEFDPPQTFALGRRKLDTILSSVG